MKEIVKEIIYVFVSLVMCLSLILCSKSAKNDVRKEKYALVLLGGDLTILLLFIIDFVIELIYYF